MHYLVQCIQGGFLDLEYCIGIGVGDILAAGFGQASHLSLARPVLLCSIITTVTTTLPGYLDSILYPRSFKLKFVLPLLFIVSVHDFCSMPIEISLLEAPSGPSPQLMPTNPESLPHHTDHTGRAC
jgi:hypothetical protein